MELKEKLQRFLNQEFKRCNKELSWEENIEAAEERALFYCKVLDGVEQILRISR